MYEFHGWATIRVPEIEAETTDETFEREEAALHELRIQLAEIDDGMSMVETRRCGNGLIVMYAHGLRNHRYPPVIDLFRWVARKLPDSYGLLYVHDQGNPQHPNEFRVWKLALGALQELADPFLSPYIPTVELPWDSRGT